MGHPRIEREEAPVGPCGGGSASAALAAEARDRCVRLFPCEWCVPRRYWGAPASGASLFPEVLLVPPGPAVRRSTGLDFWLLGGCRRRDRIVAVRRGCASRLDYLRPCAAPGGGLGHPGRGHRFVHRGPGRSARGRGC